MRRLVISTYVTLDGVVEAPETWISQFWTDEMENYAYHQLLASDALLEGRKVYQVFADSWPYRTGEFADRMNSLPKFVVSSTLEDVDWNNSTLIKGEVAEAVSQLKQQPGQDILMYGSADLMHTLMQHELIDEYRFWIAPVFVGRGKRLFREGSASPPMILADTKMFRSGVVVLSYQPAGKEANK